MVARPSRARAKPRSLYDEQAEELRKKGVELQTQDDDEENEEQDDDRSATFVAEPTQKKARARTGAVAKPRANAAPKQATALFKAVSAAKQGRKKVTTQSAAEAWAVEFATAPEKGASLLTRFAF